MSERCQQLEGLLAAAARGDFDAMTPEQVAALEAHLNTCSPCAARLARSTPVADVRVAPAVQPPSEEGWDRVWEAIEAERQTGVRQAGPARGAVHWLWRPLLAAAACILMVVIWRSVPMSETQTWELKLSDNVVVHEIETFGDLTSLVVYPAEDDEPTVVWFLENEGA
jgi:anti-sigma factor RsiW